MIFTSSESFLTMVLVISRWSIKQAFLSPRLWEKNSRSISSYLTHFLNREGWLIKPFHCKDNISCWPGGWRSPGESQPPARPRPRPPPGCAVDWSYLAWSSSGFLSRSAANWFLAEFYSHSNWKPAVLMLVKRNIILQNKTHSFFAFPFSTNERLSLDIILLIFQRTLTYLVNGRKTLNGASQGENQRYWWIIVLRHFLWTNSRVILQATLT